MIVVGPVFTAHLEVSVLRVACTVRARGGRGVEERGGQRGAARSGLASREEERQQPHVRFNVASKHAFWIARGTTDGDAKVEILTRSSGELPEPVLHQLRELLSGLIPSEPDGIERVLQIPMARLAEPDAREQLRGALDFALDATVALLGESVLEAPRA